MKKIVFLPLDERPCNFDFPGLMPNGGYELKLPPKELMGDKKRPGDTEGLFQWLKKETVDAYGAIISIDTLLYGGIVPSRLHYEQENELLIRLNRLKELKKQNSRLVLFGFQLIMRCPSYSSSDEEPDYYEYCGFEIFKTGRYEHLESLNMLTDADREDYKAALKKAGELNLKDYKERRQKNTTALTHSLELVQEGLFDYFIVPQDDSSEYGFTAVDQIKVRKYIKDNSLHLKISMYPGADEVGLTMLARITLKIYNQKPNIYVYYASSIGKLMIPCYEDRTLDETIKHQVYACGGRRVYSLPEADIVLFVNCGSEMVDIADKKNAIFFDINRNLCEYVEQIKYAKALGKTTAIADIAYANGGDMELLRLLENEGLLFGIDAYAGWNTSSNTIGTALCQAVLFRYGKDGQGNKSFLAHRYLEDACYCAYIRRYVIDTYLKEMGLGYFDAGGKDGKVADIVKREIIDYAKKQLPVLAECIETLTVRMPWARMFEADIKVKIK